MSNAAGRLSLLGPIRGTLMLVTALAVASALSGAQPRERDGRGRAGERVHVDSSAVVATVERLHALLEQGDSAAVLELLSPDIAVLESGGYENLSEFRAHHLPADIEFARAVTSTRTLRSVRVVGDAAWVASTSIAQGQFRGRTINSSGAELIVLRRMGTQWKIVAIHWSSRTRRS